jgi:uncharacterized protein YbjT (DUF2867 family)
MASRTALVIGASGLVGSHCLNVLLGDAAYESVTVLARKPLARTHPKLRLHVVDFDRPSDYAALAGGQDVFCCLGTTIAKAGSREAFYRVDFGYPVAIAEAALANGAEQFLIVSALGADASARAFYSRVKGEVEAAISKMPFRAVHVFRPSLLKGQRSEVRVAERMALAVAVPMTFLLVGPLRRFRPIAASVVAACMVATAKQARPGVHVFESDAISSCSQDAA